MSFCAVDPPAVSAAVYRVMDVMRSFLMPLLTAVTTIVDHASPNTLWTLMYAFILISSYLFHSPFRAHSAAMLDTYGRFMKVLQIWCVILLCFVHLGPVVIKQQKAQIEGHNVNADDFTVAYLFFPLFSCLLGFFSLFHKLKRRLRLSVTYGAHLSTLLLNSMMLATLATIHYAYMSRFLRDGAPPPQGFLAVVFWLLKSSISPASVVAHPFFAVAHLLIICGSFIFCDYQYKRLMDFDPTRGVLWADLFDLRKEREESSELAPPVEFRATGARKTQQDWRLLEAKPHRYRPEEVRAWRRVLGAARGQRVSLGELGASGVSATSPKLSERAAAVASSFLPYQYQRVVYDVQSRTRCEHCTADASSPVLSSPSSSSALSSFPEIPLSTMKLAFPTPAYEMDEIMSAKHPVGKVGMVAWWSSFAFSTAWQAGLNSALKFLTFDVRSIQQIATPKVFNLTFSKQLPSRQRDAEPATPDGSIPNTSSTDTECDVWFDWIADVGDGFNPTYDMARVLAQPRLRLKPSNEASDVVRHHKHHSHQRRDDSAVLHTAATAAATTEGRLVRQNSDVEQTKKQADYVLPRGSFVVIGGDLAYPRPTEETYTTRLFEPYRDALPGNPKLRKLFHARQMELVRRDDVDADVAHIHVLDAETVAAMACGADTLRASRGTAEEALHSVPLLFAIPGNHDWFDGLRIFRKYMLEKTWIGGWLMPQRSSFFVLRLPYNWFMLCCDTGNEKDIDVAQRNYFRDVIEKYMDASSCVILCCHEPGWLFDAMEQRTEPLQPQLDRLVSMLGTRLRLRLAGDIHNYSRHAPVDPLSEAATLVVSGGGGAYLAGARDDSIVSQGTVYKRFGAFPRHNTYLPIATRLWGFRVLNWKFDMIVGFTCFGLIFSTLPQPADVDAFAAVTNVGELATLWWNIVVSTIAYFFEEAWASYGAAMFLFACFGSAGADRPVASYWRYLNATGWTLFVLFACAAMLAVLQCMLMLLVSHGMIASTPDAWRSLVEEDAVLLIATAVELISHVFGASSFVSRGVRAAHQRFVGSVAQQATALVLRLTDAIDTLAYVSMKVSSDKVGHFAQNASRLTIGVYYLHVLLFYWLLVTPIVSFIIGLFLAISVTVFDFMYDGGYSAFQIEDFKHFMRFRIDHQTRELEVFVVGKEKVPKVWERDPRHVKGLTDLVEKDQPPHLRSKPSRWRPSTRTNREQEIASVLERFVIRPHTVPNEGNTPA